MLPPAILDQIMQSIAAAVWQRPELAPLREPVEAALKADSFFKLVQDAFQQFADTSTTALPQFFDEGFIRMPAVQEQLAAYVVRGQPVDLEQLSALYAKRFLNPAAAPDVQTQLEGYLRQVRETFATDPTYGPILLARDVQAMSAALQNLREEVRQHFDSLNADMKAYFVELFARPDRLSRPVMSPIPAPDMFPRVELTREQLRKLIGLMSNREEFAQNLDRRLFLKINGLERFLGSLQFDVNPRVFSTELVVQTREFGVLDDASGREPAYWRLLNGLGKLFENDAAALEFLKSLCPRPEIPAAAVVGGESQPTTTPYAFLSYSSPDRAFVSRLAADLRIASGAVVVGSPARRGHTTGSGLGARLARQTE